MSTAIGNANGIGFINKKIESYIPPIIIDSNLSVLIDDGSSVKPTDKKFNSLTKEQVKGIILQNDKMNIVIHPIVIKSYFCGGGRICPDVAAYSTAALASVEYNGEENTINFRKTLNIDSNWAVNKCYDTLINGKHCYLPSLGELKDILNKRDNINILLTNFGYDKLPNGQYWSSSLAGRVDVNDKPTTDINGIVKWVYGYYNNELIDWDGFNVQGLYNTIAITKYNI